MCNTMLNIYELSGEDCQLLIDYVFETYEDYPKMCENQIYQLKLKFSKWRKKGNREWPGGIFYAVHTAEELKWEKILEMKKQEAVFFEKYLKLKRMYNELKNAREISK